MKVCVATGAYAPYSIGGGEESAKLLADGLLSRGLDVVVLTIGEEETEELIDGVRVVRLKPFNFYWGTVHSKSYSGVKKVLWHLRESYNFTVASKLKTFFEDERPDILHVRNITDISSYIWKVGKERGVKVVTTVNNYASLCIKASMFSNGKICDKLCTVCKTTAFIKRMQSHHVDAVVGVSQFTLDKHLEYGFFKNSKKRVIYTHVDVKEYKPLPITNNDKVTFGFIGRIDETKGVLEIIKEFVKLNTGAKLIVAGIGDEEYLKQCKLAANNSIEFTGKLSQIDFYNRVDVVVINSLWNEPFPRVLVESYSYGRPVIATEYGGTKELVKEGETGFLYNPEHKDIGDLFLKYESIDKSKLLEMSKACIEQVKSVSVDDIQQYIDLYSEL